MHAVCVCICVARHVCVWVGGVHAYGVCVCRGWCTPCVCVYVVHAMCVCGWVCTLCVCVWQGVCTHEVCVCVCVCV